MGKKIQKIKDVTIGEFVKYSDSDNKGKYQYHGQIIKIDDITNMIWMLTFIGELGFDLKKKYDLEVTDEVPIGWDKYIIDPEKYRMTRALKAVKKRENEEQKQKDAVQNFKTTKQQIEECVIANIDKDNTEILKLLKNNKINITDDTNKQITLFKLKHTKDKHGHN